jgi:hypothetical protein
LPGPLFDQMFADSAVHRAYGAYWSLKKAVPRDLAATIDANNKNLFDRQTKPIIDSLLVPDDFVMAVGAYAQCLHVSRRAA